MVCKYKKGRDKTMKKKLLSVVMVIAIIISIIPITGFAKEEGENERYTVLVLDTSGEATFLDNTNKIFYTSNTEVENVKKAAVKFVENILNADGKNYIAVVSFKNTAEIVSDFTDNEQDLISKINMLYATGDTRDMSAGLSHANVLLDGIGNIEAEKNVVLFSTGYSNEGAYDYNGYYDESTIASNWRRINNQIRFYAYANSAYNEAEIIKEKAKIYSLGFFQNIDDIPVYMNSRDLPLFFRLVAENLATSENYFYEVEDPDKIEITFGDIADRIINPLGVKLSHKLISADLTNSSGCNRYLYRITAQVENTANQTADNVVCTLNIPQNAVSFEDMVSSREQAEKVIGDIPAGESKTVIWDLEINHPADDDTVIYTVNAKSDNSVDIQQSEIIYVSPFDGSDNTFIFGEDQWGFSNSYEYFSPEMNEKYYITNEDYDALVYNTTNIEKERINAYLYSNWSGSCYGMSSTAILTKMGVFDADDIKSGGYSLYSLQKKNDDKIESFVNYYQMMQILDIPKRAVHEFDIKPAMEKIQFIENEAKKVVEGGSPLLIGLYFEGGYGHAVVGYGYEKGAWMFGTKTYNSRILIYDCNDPDDAENSCIYYNEGESDCYIPNYNLKRIGFATSKLELVDNKNHTTANANVLASIRAKNLSQYKIIIDNNEYTVNPDTFDTENGIYARFDFGPKTGKNLELYIDNENSAYTVQPGNYDNNFELTFDYGDVAFDAYITSADKITVDPQGEITVNNAERDYTLTLVTNTVNDTTPWYKTMVSGDEAKNVSLKQTEEGIILEGDNLSGVKITTKDDVTEREQQIITEKTSVLVKADEYDTHVVMVDSDDNGTYDTVISSAELDYDVSDWAKSEVSEAKDRNLIPKEMIDDDLTQNITRAEFSAVAVKLYEALSEKSLIWHGGYILDIDGNVYEDYIRGAYSLGITNGTGGNEDTGVIFSPDKNITREQLATMLLRTIKTSEFEDWMPENDYLYPFDIRGASKFADDNQISDYAIESVYYMSKNNIIKGVDSTHFAPKSTATKEQAILLALRIYNSFNK